MPSEKAQEKGERAERCVFCKYEGPSEVLYRGQDAYIIEPLNPVVPGHLLVVAYQHIDDFAENGYIAGKVMETASWWVRRNGYHESGDYNLITSKGRAATQSVRHLHLHLIPRHESDELRLPWSIEPEEREAKLREALERIIRLPCAHPDDRNEHKRMALDFVKAQEIAEEVADFFAGYRDASEEA